MSKNCAPYAQACKDKCCDKNGECPDFSGRPCHYQYAESAEAKTAVAATATAGAATGDAASKDDATQKVQANNSVKTTTTTTTTTTQKTEGDTKAETKAEGDTKTETKAETKAEGETKAETKAEGEPKAQPTLNAQTESKTQKSSDADIGPKTGEATKSSGNVVKLRSRSGRSLPDGSGSGWLGSDSSSNIIALTLLGLALGMLALSLIFLFCRRRWYGSVAGSYPYGVGMPPMAMPPVYGQGGVVPGTPIPPPGIANAIASATMTPVGHSPGMLPSVPITRTGSVMRYSATPSRF